MAQSGNPDGEAALLSFPPREEMHSRDSWSIALLGAPYVGKSTLFNLLTGLSQRQLHTEASNLDLRIGSHRQAGQNFDIVDLPSVYSLTSNSPDEIAARDYIARERPDLVVVMLNAANLERTLYLVSEVLELPSPVVVAVNMMDVATREGGRLDAEVLQAALGVPVIAMAVARGENVPSLLDAAGQLVQGQLPYGPKRPEFDPQLESLLEDVEGLLDDEITQHFPRRWVALKLLEGDRDITQMAQQKLSPARWTRLNSLLAQNEDAVVAIASARYEWIERMVRAALFRPIHGAVTLTERVDRVATHPQAGPLLLLGLLGFLFWMVYQVASPLVALLAQVVSMASGSLAETLSNAPPWIVGMLVDGAMGGVGTVLSLLPLLVVFFLGMALLQNVGYMARAAFVADRFMHSMGLHGESLIPLFLGFGCNVPAVFGTRMIESRRARLLTILVTPLVPCSGRMAVLVFMAGALFGNSAPMVTWGLVAFNLVLLALSGVFFDRAILHSERPALIMELPLYHRPNWRAVALETWQSTKDFIVRAGTVILLVSVLIWGLAELPNGVLQESYLAQAGRYLEPLGGLMGLDWRMMVALLTSFVAKENALATMSVLAAAGQDSTSLMAALPQMLTQASALAYLVLQITFIPCVSTVAAMHRQTQSWRWTGFSLGYLLILSLAMGIATYQFARLLGWGM